ncbi:hypothetical protein [Actinomyces israelii]|uniref:hypothetical protein n=1 Tax=Actinomyces israelii TaxID=1659 RepID=UPI0005BCD12B|nr:hypothetical protein [Actinomyces israelii]
MFFSNDSKHRETLMKTFHRVTAVTAAALLSASLAACSSTSPRNDSSGDSKDQESSAQPTAVSAQPAPAGYQMVTTSTSKISFAIPDNWQILSKDAAQDDQRVQAIADALGKSPDEVRTMLSSLDMQAMSTAPDDKGFTENVNVEPVTGPTSLPTENDMSQMIQGQNGTPGEYSTTQTALGEVAVMTYTMTVQTTTVQGAVIAVRTKDGTWTLIWVSTSETSRAKELAGIITSTLS